MIISVWRYSHLALAVSSFVFILIASLTGIVLALEPVIHKAHGFDVTDASELPLAKVVPVLEEKYAEVLDMKVDNDKFVSVSVITDEGAMEEFYINPFTGEKTRNIIKKAEIFQWATNLHRSLFLKSTGRFFVGLSSFLLFLIAVSGIVLVIKRQQGIRYFFSRIIKENFFQYYHIYLGRLALLPILVITLTGVYLSLLRFSLIPEVIPKHNFVSTVTSSLSEKKLQEFPVFESTNLSEARSLEFPFSDDPEDYYRLALSDREILIHQYTGEIISEVEYPMVNLLSEWSIILHTGSGSIMWSVVLGLSSVSILFFIYSGFSMTFKRRSRRIRNKYNKDSCKYIILTGSETGNTLYFARLLHEQLLKAGERSYISELNRYTTYKSAEHFVVITATYGQGEPPTNARKFERLFKETKTQRDYTYSVVGFGSLAYADFCKYAFDIDKLIQSDTHATRLLPPYTINNRSWEAYNQWVDQWSERVGVPISMPEENPNILRKKKKQAFELIQKTKAEDSSDDTFIVYLQAVKKQKYQSGDLLAIYPPDNEHERLYSIGFTAENHILLSVKRHEKGICSNYLNKLEKGDIIHASVIRNRDFHFPAKAKRIIMISTGTGIAPFLGMLMHNTGNTEVHLYWGGRNENSLSLYNDHIHTCLRKKHLSRFIPAFSRNTPEKIYVQNKIEEDKDLIAETLRDKGVIMICGSIAMQKEVIKVLDQISVSINEKPLSYYQKRGQLRMDCY